MPRRVIVIVGASRGIGASTARALAVPGTILVLAARDHAALQRVADEVQQAGGIALTIACDVTNEADVQTLMTTASAITGQIDVLISAAGQALITPVAELSLIDWERMLRVGLTGPFLLCRYALMHMQSGATILLLASVAGRQAFPGWAAYAAAKAGLLALAATLREELRPRGIRVAALLPAATDTGLWDGLPGTWNRATMLSAEAVARTIAWVIAQPVEVVIEELTIGHVAGRL